MTIPRGKLGMAVLDGKLYAVGGQEDDGTHLRSVEVFDPQRGMWEAGPQLATTRCDFGLAELDGKLYAVGGNEADYFGRFPLISVEVFDPQRGVWEAGPRLIRRRASFGMAVLDGKLYVVGGDIGTGDFGSPSVEVFDPQHGMWEVGPPLTTGRDYFGLAMLVV